MGEDFEDSVDTSSFDDISTDTTDTSSFSDPVDVGDMMDDIPAEPLESFDVEPLDSSFETELPTAEATDIDSLMDGAADTYMTEEVPSDTLDSSGLDPSDLSSDIDDYEMDAGSDMVDLMDKAAMESLDDVSLDSSEANETNEDDIEALMNDAETVSEADENLPTTETNAFDGGEETEIEVESILNTEEVPSSEASDLQDDIPSDITEDASELLDVSDLMDETEINDPGSFVDESLENTTITDEMTEMSPAEADIKDEVATDEISDIDEPSDSIVDKTDADNNIDIQEIQQDTQEETEMTLDMKDTPLDAELSAYDQLAYYYNSHNYGQQDYAEYSKDPEWQELNNAYLQEQGREPVDYSNGEAPLDAELPAYDQLEDYYNSHNYGQQDYAEYSKDPEWQELNNAYLQEQGREPVDYSNGEAPNINDIRDELIAAGIPEGGSELDAILANEQAGINMSNNSKTEGNIIEEDMNDLLSREPLEQSDSDVYKAKTNSEIPIIQEDGTVDTLENIMNRVDQDTPAEHLDAEPYKATPISEIPIAQEGGTVDTLENIMNRVDQDTPTEHLDVEPYKTIPLSDTTVVQEDSAVDSLESLMDQEEQEMNNGSYDSAPEALSSEELPNQSRIDELKAEKEELLSLKEQLLEYQQEHPKEIDQDEGAIVRVLKKDGSDTSVVHHDYEAELADLDKGITEWQKVQEEWAAGLNEGLKQISENPNLSEAERAELIKDNYAKRDLFSQNYDKEFAELQAAREELAGKVSSSQLDATNAVQEIDVTDVPKLEDVSDWINDINPNYDPFDWQSPYSNNCGSCAFAVEQRLDGNTDISATSENIGTIEEMNKITGMEQVAMSPDEIKDYLVSQGPGSHGIVGIDRVSGPGHWFNAYYDGEKVVAIDGQTGEINDWPPDYGDVTNWDISVRKEEA